MSRKTFHAIVLAAAATFGPALAWGQYQVRQPGNEGRAIDASNRLGSGGYNTAPRPSNFYVNPNQLIYGNVTGGKQFRGQLQSTDPFAFRGELGGSASDRFIRGSSGVTTGGQTSFNASQTRSFFGFNRGVAGPAGTTQQPFTGGYVRTPSFSRQAGDARLGAVAPIGSAPEIVAARPGQFALPGQVDPSGQQTTITASPIFGVRQFAGYAPSFNELSSQRELTATALTGLRPETTTVEKAREELAALAGSAAQPVSARALTAERTEAAAQGQSALPRPFEQAVANPLAQATTGTLSTALSTGLSNTIQTGQGVGHRVLTPVPMEQQSAQYAELKRRLGERPSAGATDPAEASRLYNEQVRALQQQEQARQQAALPQIPAAPEAPQTPAGVTDYAERTRQLMDDFARQQATPADPNARPPEATGLVPGQTTVVSTPRPLLVTSLAEGIESPSLRSIMADAEQFMKDGKFSTALDRYDLAEQASPNNPLVMLGRGHAELGASYYGRAYEHLRRALLGDRALLMGQYDLKSFIGQERLEFLVRDLRQIARNDAGNATAVLLLAYIDYNTQNERRAAGYLRLAEQRLGAEDALVRQLKQFWVLPAVEAADPTEMP